MADVRRLLFDRLDEERIAALADALSIVAGHLAPCPGTEVTTAP